MSANGPVIPPGGVPLDRRGQVLITDQRLLHIAGADLNAGGLSQPDAIAHLRVIDLPRARAYLIPMDQAALEKLAQAAAQLLDELSAGKQSK